jgi:4-hydroxythreonine-4-phosphate dehydrogenase
MSAAIGITLGDVTGIGPEVALKALGAEITSADAGTRFVLIGDRAEAERWNRRLELGLELREYSGEAGSPPISILDPSSIVLAEGLGCGDPRAARAAVAWLAEGARRCLRGELRALVTAPVNKEAILRSGQAFVGQTEFLSALAGTERTAMMLLGADDRGHVLRVALVTTHLPLRDVARAVTCDRVAQTIELAAGACRDLGLRRARVGVCGLNPHAGEGGQIGDEEITAIGPAVAAARARGIDAAGPLAADTMFYQAYRGDFDAVVAMYHDQGLAPLKMIGFETGINWTLGLPFVRTSPDHGTAYDIAGRGLASAESMRAAIRLAKQLC